MDSERPVRRAGGADRGGRPRVAVLGAGVIGRVLAARLVRGGVDAVLLARGATAEALRRDGVRLRMQGTVEHVGVRIVAIDDAEPLEPVDVLFLCLRADALDAVLPRVADLGTPVVVPMMHLGDRHADLVARFGAQQVVRVFPGYGGYLDAAGAVEWLDLRAKQPTTVEVGTPAAETVCDLLESCDLPLDRVEDMDGWIAAHLVLITGLAAAVLNADGDLRALTSDRRAIRVMVDAVRDGFLALRDRGVRIAPWPVALLFLRMPRAFAVEYWRRALAGPVGAISIAPHVLASRADELPLLIAEALRVSGGGRTGALARLLRSVHGGPAAATADPTEENP